MQFVISRLKRERPIKPDAMLELVSREHGLRTTDYGLQTTDYGLRSTDYRLRTGYKTLTKHYGLGIKYGLGYKTRTEHYGLGIKHEERFYIEKILAQTSSGY